MPTGSHPQTGWSKSHAQFCSGARAAEQARLENLTARLGSLATSEDRGQERGVSGWPSRSGEGQGAEESWAAAGPQAGSLGYLGRYSAQALTGASGEARLAQPQRGPGVTPSSHGADTV